MGKARGLHLLTGFDELDDLLAGLRKSDLVIIAGLPNTGKTELALCMTSNILMKCGVPVLYFSSLRSSGGVLEIIMRQETGLDFSSLGPGKAKDVDFLRMYFFLAQLEK